MLKKITLLAILIPGLALVQACCGDYHPYFSYSALTIREPFDPVSPNALLQPVKRFLIYPAAVQYLASAKPAINIGAALMAWSCNPDGDLGAKVPIERVEITSDQPFGQDYPAGAIINDFFAVYGENYDTYQPVPLDVWYDQQQFDYAPGYTSLLLLMPAAPADISLVHRFSFTFILADGTQASGVLEGVRFE